PRRRPRQRDADARRAERVGDSGDDPLDDLQARVDEDDPSAHRVHVGAQAAPDGGLRRDRTSHRLPGRSPDQPRARRPPDRPAQPLARALPACGRGRPHRERPQREGLLRGAHAHCGPATGDGVEARLRLTSYSSLPDDYSPAEAGALTMRAARLHELGGAPVVDEVDAPEGSNVVAVSAAALNPVDIAIGNGRFYGGSPETP